MLYACCWCVLSFFAYGHVVDWRDVLLPDTEAHICATGERAGGQYRRDQESHGYRFLLGSRHQDRLTKLRKTDVHISDVIGVTLTVRSLAPAR